jgi:hypothetical protein
MTRDARIEQAANELCRNYLEVVGLAASAAMDLQERGTTEICADDFQDVNDTFLFTRSECKRIFDAFVNAGLIVKNGEVHRLEFELSPGFAGWVSADDGESREEE